MPELLLLCEYPTLSGGERSMLATLDGVQKAGFGLAVVAPPQGPLVDAIEDRGVEVLPFRFRDATGARLPQARLRQQLARLISRRSCDLLHANSLSMGRLSGPVVEELALASIAHLRDIIKLSARAMADLNRHKRLLAVSEATLAFHAKHGLSVDKTHVLFNGVDLERFRPRPSSGYLHLELRLPAETRLVGTIGQICLRKGQDVLIQAAASLADEYPSVHYLVVGDRWSEKSESRQFEDDMRTAAAGRLAGRVHFLGFRNDVDRLLNELTLLVHSSRQEPLGRVLLEAAASGVAVVATDVGGSREIFPPPSRAARLVPPDDVQAMQTAIGELLKDETLRADLACSARLRAEAAFDVKRTVQSLVEHYHAVLNR